MRTSPSMSLAGRGRVLPLRSTGNTIGKLASQSSYVFVGKVSDGNVGPNKTHSDYPRDSTTSNKQSFAEYVPMLWSASSSATGVWDTNVNYWLTEGGSGKSTHFIKASYLGFELMINPNPQCRPSPSIQRTRWCWSSQHDTSRGRLRLFGMDDSLPWTCPTRLPCHHQRRNCMATNLPWWLRILRNRLHCRALVRWGHKLRLLRRIR